MEAAEVAVAKRLKVVKRFKVGSRARQRKPKGGDEAGTGRMVMQKLIRAGKVARRVEDPEARAAAEGAAGVEVAVATKLSEQVQRVLGRSVPPAGALST